MWVYVSHACPLAAEQIHLQMNTFAVVNSTKKRIHAEECEDKKDKKYSKGYFSCIDCENDVFVRRGEKRARHFAHYQEEDTKKCPHANGGETKEHYDAKHFIANNIGRCAFAIERCPTCSRKRFFLGDDDDEVQVHECKAEVEARIPGTNRVADVAAMHPLTGTFIAAIEVLHTHETDADKRSECAMVGIPVLEVTTDEVQRVKELVGAYGFMQMHTTHIQKVYCSECGLARAWTMHLHEAVQYEEWYTSVHESFFCRNVCTRPSFFLSRREYDKQEKEHLSAEVEYSSWYEGMWDRYEKQRVYKREHELLSNERSHYLQKGLKHARTRLAQLSSGKKKRYRGKSCITKCKVCANWVFNDDEDDVCEVESSTMFAADWSALFDNDPPQYRKRYKLKNNDHNFIYVHAECAMDCPACTSSCILKQLGKYGICYSCDVYFRQELSKLGAKIRRYS